MSGDDLAPLLGGGTGPDRVSVPVAYRKGTLLAFNVSTRANLVRIGAVEFQNLSMLDSTPAASYVVGDQLAIAVIGTTWLILGRILTP